MTYSTLDQTFNINSFVKPNPQKIYLAIYQSDHPYWTYDKLFDIGLSSSMLGVGTKHYPYKEGQLVLNIAKTKLLRYSNYRLFRWSIFNFDHLSKRLLS